VGRVADGISHRVHRLKGLGNAQVPLQAAIAYRLLNG
jgi:DNA (cytosine-5)-methyltransferase 1